MFFSLIIIYNIIYDKAGNVNSDYALAIRKLPQEILWQSK